ncbi:diaminopimelate epimerase [Pelagovum pacificum]|nr:diaminopimelate epimerase [Pelagovum pacificum]
MKMHGLGNDFVVIDGRAGAVEADSEILSAMADRRRGIGFDQLVIIGPSEEGGDFHLSFWNSDGSRSATCGNATRCVAAQMMNRTGQDMLRMTTERGILHALRRPDGEVAVNLGHPDTHWRDIPLSEEVDSLHLPIEGDPVATGMGNPHCTFFVEDVSAIDLATFGPSIEHHPLFPERTNVQIAQVLDHGRIRMRVWERGAGITEASGSSSCAVTVAAARRGLTGRQVTIELDGGELEIRWSDDGVWMKGPAAHVYDGVWYG